MTNEEYEAVKRFCLETWNTKDPDALDAWHALRVLRIQKGHPVPHFDDFILAWKKFNEAQPTDGTT